MEWYRSVMLLARFGVAPSEVERDPRPSRLTALLEAGRVIEARLRLEDTEDTVASGGVQGEIRETYPPGKAPKPSGIKTELVGYKRRQDTLRRQAYPELYTPDAMQAAHIEEQQRKAATFFDTGGTGVTAMRLRVVYDENGEATFVQVAGGQDAGEGTGAHPQGGDAGRGEGRP